jgi:L-tyrosine isonitrile synthase
MPAQDPRLIAQTARPIAHQQARKQQPKQPTQRVDAGRIIASFNTWAFKREQPSDAAMLHSIVAAAVDSAQPLQFALYWGKGPRTQIAQPDLDCLDYLAAMAGRIKQAYAPGAAVYLIFTDTHATLNGHSSAAMSEYFEAIAAAGSSRSFLHCRLSDVVRDQSSVHKWTVPPIRSLKTIESLKRSAERWYRGSSSVADGAIAYYDMNMIEKRAVEQQFPAAIFITFNGSELRDLFPDTLPIFYMYSLRKGFGVKPWFLDEDGVAVAKASLPLLTTIGPLAT